MQLQFQKNEKYKKYKNDAKKLLGFFNQELWESYVLLKSVQNSRPGTHMSVFNFLCTEIGTFWPNRDPPKLKPNFWKLFEHHISFQSQLCTCSPHFFLRLHLLTTFLIKVALAHHISFYGCTCSPHFFLRLHLLTTFLFTSRFRVQGLKHDIGRKFQLLYTCRCKK